MILQKTIPFERMPSTIVGTVAAALVAAGAALVAAATCRLERTQLPAPLPFIPPLSCRCLPAPGAEGQAPPEVAAMIRSALHAARISEFCRFPDPSLVLA